MQTKSNRESSPSGLLFYTGRAVVVAAALAILTLPGWVMWDLYGSDVFSESILFRLVGVYAFSLLSIQVLLGAYLPLLGALFGRSLFPIHVVLGVTTYVFAFTHPILLSASPGWDPAAVFLPSIPDSSYYAIVSLGRISLFLLTLTVLAGLLRNRLGPVWRRIHWLNYVIFPLIWFKSWQIGSDIRETPLEYLWLVLMALFLGGTLYRFAPRVLRRKLANP